VFLLSLDAKITESNLQAQTHILHLQFDEHQLVDRLKYVFLCQKVKNKKKREETHLLEN
jgi:hypothetical protein